MKNYQKIRNLVKKPIFTVLILFLISLVSLGWSKEKLLVLTGDMRIPLRAKDLIKIRFTVWNEQFYLGTPMGNIFNELPYILFWRIFEIFGLGISNIQKIWIYLIFLLSGLSMYFLSNIFFENEVTRLLTSIFYMFNPLIFSFYTQSGILNPHIIAYGLRPLYLYLFIKICLTNKNKYVFYLILFSLLGVFVAKNPPTYISMWFPIFLYLIFILFLRENKRFKIIKKSIILFLLVFLINLFWISNFLILILYSNNFLNIQESSTLTFLDKNSGLTNLFRFLGRWGWGENSNGSPYYPYSDEYESEILIYLQFLILVVSISSLLNKDIIKKEIVIFLSITLVFSYFISKGSNPPFGFFFVFIRNIFPLSFFRELYLLAMPLVSIVVSILLGISFNIYCDKIKFRFGRDFKTIIFILIFLVIMVISFPIFTGDIIPLSREGNLPGNQIKIPRYWLELSQFINKFEEGRVLLLPENIFYQVHYNWNPNDYRGQEIAKFLIMRPLIFSKFTYGNYIKSKESIDMINLLYESLSDEALNDCDYLKALNVRHIILRKDIDHTYFGKGNPKSPIEYENVLNKKSYIEPIEKFENLTVYRVGDECYLPKLYLSSNISKAKKVLHLSVENTTNLSSIDRINPTFYHINMDNLENFSFLIFSESYSDSWKIYDGRLKWWETLFKKPLKDEGHYLVNGYSNAWLIKPKINYRKGISNEFTLYYFPQNLFYFCLIISLIVLFYLILNKKILLKRIKNV